MLPFRHSIPRTHKNLLKYSKAQLDAAEIELIKSNQLKVPLISWIFFILTALILIVVRILGHYNYAPAIISLFSGYKGIVITLIPLYIGMKTFENNMIQLTINCIEKNKKLSNKEMD
jgi:hypothetical protein